MNAPEFFAGARKHLKIERGANKLLCHTSITRHEAVLDPIALGEYLDVPDGKSTEETVRERFGDEAVAWCREAMKL